MGKPRLAAGEIAREAARILPRLASAGACLAELAQAEQFGLFTARGHGKKPVLKLAAALVRAFAAAEWIAPGSPPAGAGIPKTVFVLTDVGRARARRSDTDDAFRRQHQALETRHVTGPDGITHGYAINAGESPLGWLGRRRDGAGRPLLSEAEVAAGERLRADYTLAGLSPRTTMDWSFSPGTAPQHRGAQAGAVALTDAALAARERVARALAAAGPDLADILLRVVCHLEGLEAAEQALGWPRRSAKLVLQIGLKRLALHYGLARLPVSRARMSAWRGAGV